MKQNSKVIPFLWKEGRVRLLDQTRLPNEVVYVDCRRARDVWLAIRKLKVRGAPLLGIAAALGFWLGFKSLRGGRGDDLIREARRLRAYLVSSRPTAVNVAWALRQMEEVVVHNAHLSKDRVLAALEKKIKEIIDDDVRMCLRMGEHGAQLVRDGARLLTVCNAGGLATSGGGTALSVFYRAQKDGKKIWVTACETRPLLQGARLTAWELAQAKIDVTLICDNMAADLMRRRAVDAVFVGADRIAANGDFANKIGTYMLAVCARHHGIPFYCVAPFSTFDMSLSDGRAIPIEERDPAEVTSLYFRRPIAPPSARVFNPAFDVTPHALVTAIITEKGVIRPPFGKNIRSLYGSGAGKNKRDRAR